MFRGAVLKRLRTHRRIADLISRTAYEGEGGTN